MKYEVYFNAAVVVTDIDQVINWVDQGWVMGESCKYHSSMLYLHKCEIIEAADAQHIKMYARAINGITGIDQCVSKIIDSTTGEVIDFYNYIEERPSETTK